ncbi:MAG: hypothetical protein V3T31_00215, partial [candidate division Zixibacteria bacterium]
MVNQRRNSITTAVFFLLWVNLAVLAGPFDRNLRADPLYHSVAESAVNSFPPNCIGKELDFRNLICEQAESAMYLPTWVDFPKRAPAYEQLDPSPVVHPSILYFPDGYLGYKYWMAYTLWNGSARRENPHVVVSNDGVTFSLFYNSDQTDSLENPLYTPEELSLPAAAHLSDPDLFLTNEGELAIAFRVTDKSLVYDPDDTVHYIVAGFTSDGLTWTNHEGLSNLPISDKTVDTLIGPAAGSARIMSPSVVTLPSTGYQMWLVDHDKQLAQSRIIRLTSDNPHSNWILADTCQWPVSNQDFKHWHLDVIPDDSGRYVGLVNETELDSTGTGGHLCISNSIDGGLTWSASKTILLPGLSDGDSDSWTSNGIYRSSAFVLE